MDFSKPVTPLPEDLVVNDEQELRGQRVWLMINVCAATWAIFTAAFILRGYIAAGQLCFAQLCFTATIWIYFRKSNDYCRLMQVIAEGVETQEQMDVLSEFGCEQYQGYFFSRPVSAEDFERLFEPKANIQV